MIIKNILYTVVFSLIAWLIFSLISAKNEIISLKSSVSLQNQEIKRLKIETKKYEKDFTTKKKQLEDKYSRISKATSTCEDTIIKLEKLLELWTH